MAEEYSKHEGLDYHETFSPVVKMVTIIAVISMAIFRCWEIQQMDIYNVFLQRD